ncbi:helix-turn-helix domain-containing protein [Nocardia grenadensis]
MTIIRWTGLEVAALRTALRDTQVQFADRIGCSIESVGKWERRGADITLGAKYSECMDTARRRLDEEQRARFAAARQYPPGPLRTPNEDLSSSSRAGLVSGVKEIDDMKRREFGKFAVVAATTAAFPESHSHGSSVKVDDRLIDEIESALSGAMEQDDRFGPWLALRSVLDQQSMIRSILPDCPTRFRSRLISVYANVTRFAGWLYFDMGDHASASRCYEIGRMAAHESGDAELAAFTLSHMSHLAVWSGNPRLGADHAEAALSWARRSRDPLLIADTAEMAARAYALIPGEESAVLAALDENESCAAENPQPEKSLAYFYGPGFAAAARSTCLRQLGYADRAADAARESLDLIEPSFVRARAFSKLELGNAHIRQHEIEAAVCAFVEAAELADRNNSGRLVESLRESRALLTPWNGLREVHEFDERLDTYGFATGSSRT